MSFILLASGTSLEFKKDFMTAGSDPSLDLLIPASKTGVQFTVSRTDSTDFISPHQSRLTVNGHLIKSSTALRNCDRIEWEGGVGIYFRNLVLSESQSLQQQSLELLHALSQEMDRDDFFLGGFRRILHLFVNFSQAESGALLMESEQSGKWELMASSESQQDSKAFLSQTILNEAIQTRKPVYVESLIEHPWATKASILSSQIFSVACVPLFLGSRIHGALFLYTKTPGKCVRRSALEQLVLVGCQASLLAACRIELRKSLRVIQTLRSSEKSSDEHSQLTYTEESPMKEVAERARKLAATDLCILIEGETGTGKELVAQSLHHLRHSDRRPFIALNCAAIPASLMESTLFGYEKGAFTGADRQQVGKFQMADRGTLFLDEIGDLPLELQGKLLRVLQEKVIEPVGSKTPVPVEVSVVAATHRSLPDMVRAGTFRQDLYFRLSGATLRVPPLRERKVDIPELVLSMLQKLPVPRSLAPDAMERLLHHPWPGNVRELQNVIKKAAAFSVGTIIEVNDLELQSQPIGSDDRYVFNDEFLNHSLLNLKDAQDHFTRDYVRRVLDEVDGNRRSASERLGVSERTLYRILADTNGSLS